MEAAYKMPYFEVYTLLKKNDVLRELILNLNRISSWFTVIVEWTMCNNLFYSIHLEYNFECPLHLLNFRLSIEVKR